MPSCILQYYKTEMVTYNVTCTRGNLLSFCISLLIVLFFYFPYSNIRI